MKGVLDAGCWMLDAGYQPAGQYFQDKTSYLFLLTVNK
ncbi:MAG: hypothetical protein JWM28_1921 [Chitinophagaceae bacterium]|nr:hypothetical protein [Chitinophagaceae bacterium]